MYCRHCGKQIADESRFCQYCGTELSVNETDEEKHNKKIWANIIGWSAVITLVVVLVFCLRAGRTVRTDSKSMTEASPTALLTTAEAHYKAGNYYEAFMAAAFCENKTNNKQTIQKCEDLISDVAAALKENEPLSGTELARTFSVSGGGQLQVTAESGPTEVTVVDNDNENNYVRFYVRKNETAVIYLPAGEYSVTYKVGRISFDDSIGFGEYYSEGKVNDVLKFEVSFVPGWVENSIWTLKT